VQYESAEFHQWRFEGMSPDGLWVLYMADVASRDSSTFAQWSLRLEMVPEPRGLAPGTSLALLLVAVHRLARTKPPVRS